MAWIVTHNVKQQTNVFVGWLRQDWWTVWWRWTRDTRRRRRVQSRSLNRGKVATSTTEDRTSLVNTTETWEHTEPGNTRKQGSKMIIDVIFEKSVSQVDNLGLSQTVWWKIFSWCTGSDIRINSFHESKFVPFRQNCVSGMSFYIIQEKTVLLNQLSLFCKPEKHLDWAW